ncbi:MAG: hypothetical protein AABX05_03215 [Nanoarchaeota archaeon]
MVLPTTKVQCFGCGKSVEKALMFSALDASKEMQHQCSSCYRERKSDILGEKKIPAPVKKDFFCGRCRYKFKGKTMICPYCSKEDQVIKQANSVNDLL